MTRRDSYQHGTITQAKRSKGPDVWVFRYYRYDIHGNAHRAAEQFSDLRECPTLALAERKAVAIRKRINEERVCVYFSDLADKYVAEDLPNVRPHTQRSYRSSLKQLRARWDRVRLDEMTKDIMSIQLWVNTLKNPAYANISSCKIPRKIPGEN